MNRLHLSYQLVRHFGPSWLLFRLRYAIEHRLGVVERQLPATTWEEQPLQQWLRVPALADENTYLAYRKQSAPLFFFAPTDRDNYRGLLQQWQATEKSPIARADQLRHGKLRYFSGQVMEVGCPPEWHTNPFSGEFAPADQHWSRISEFAYGDVKAIWEASRFGFVYDLVRAYWRTGDEEYAACFWQLVHDWRVHNQPQQGLNWKCGQEASLRLMAWCFGLYGFLGARATTASRVTELAQMIAVSGKRIEANLGYAISQRNNHGISEAMGLWTIGLLFPEFTAAQRWQETGKAVLERLAQELIYEDGAFVQHSFNYQRLMLHDYLWAIRLGDIHGKPLKTEVRKRVGSAAALLYQCQDDSSGQLPRYGQNDGALILPLNNCSYDDYRPICQAISFLIKGERCYGDGPWNEDLLWLFGPEALQAAVEPERRETFSTSSGYHLIRTTESFLFTRCGVYQDRPGQADMLHVDLWWRGHNIALDPGTYSYNAPSPWNNVLASTTYHNTVIVDGCEQMERVGKFLWLPWVHGQVVTETAETGVCYWEGEHDGYQRLHQPVTYRRAICHLAEGIWLILDRLNSDAKHRYQCHWNLADRPHTFDTESRQLALQVDGSNYYLQLGSNVSDTENVSLIRTESESPRGWYAPRYFMRKPALSITYSSYCSNQLIWSLFGPYPSKLYWSENKLEVRTDSLNTIIEIDMRSNNTIIQQVHHKIVSKQY